MPDPTNSSAHIGRVGLRIHGRDAAFGRRVGQGVGTLLEQGFPNFESDLGAIHLRVSVARGATESDITQTIAASIVWALKGRRR